MEGDFNPDDYLQTDEGSASYTVSDSPEEKGIKVEEDPPAGWLESLARGGAQGYTSGFSDELTGLAESSLSKKSYEQSRDEARLKNQHAQKSNPFTYGAGVMAGGVGQVFTPGLNVAGKAGPVVGGAISGAASGLGFSNEKDPEGMLQDTAIGAGTGAAFGQVLGKTIPGIAGKLSRTAEERAYKAAAGQSLKDIKKEAAAGRITQDAEGLSLSRGRDLLEADEAGPAAVGWFDKTEDIAPKLSRKREFYGKKIGEVGESADEAMPGGSVSSQSLRENLERQTSQLPKNPETEAMSQKLKDHLESIIAGREAIPFSEAQKQKNYYQWSPSKNLSAPADKDLHSTLHSTFGKGMDEGVEAASKMPGSKSEVLKDYGKYKGKYSTYAGADDQAFERSLRNLSNRSVSPTDYGVGMAAGAGMLANSGQTLTSAVLGLGAGAANKVARERGSAFVARSADAMAKALESVPEVLGKYAPILLEAQKRGAGQLMLTHQLLLQTKPDYADTINKISGQEGDAQ